MSDSRVTIKNPGTGYAELEIKSKWNVVNVSSIFVSKEMIGSVDLSIEDTTIDGSYLSVYLSLEETKELVKFLQLQIDRAEKNI